MSASSRPRSGHRSLPRLVGGALLLVLALALACDRPETTEPEFKTVSGPAFIVSPGSLAFAIPPRATATLTASVQFTGAITARTSDAGCATVSPLSVPAGKPQGSSQYVATFTVTPTGLGSCTVTLTDKQGRQVPVPVSVSQGVVRIRRSTFVAGSGATCGLITSGAAYCWGDQGFGQLGNGSTTPGHQLTPALVLGGLSFASLTAGGDHTCGLAADGKAYCWGSSDNGQRGDGTTDRRGTPVAVAGPAGGAALTFSSLSAGTFHTCGVVADGTAYCWGDNSYGELGDGTTTQRLVPTPVAGGQRFAAVSAGSFYTCGLTGAGKAYCWGSNVNYQLGDGSATNHASPSPVSGDLTFASIDAGPAATTCAVTTAGAGYCWGGNFHGPVGDGTTTDRSTPTAVTGGLTFTDIAAGWAFACGTTTGALLYCWGDNDRGELGDGTLTDHASPAAVLGPAGGAALGFAIVGVFTHTCGVTSSGAAYCWGDNEAGELGDGSTTDRTTPMPVVGPGGGAALVFQTP